MKALLENCKVHGAAAVSLEYLHAGDYYASISWAAPLMLSDGALRSRNDAIGTRQLVAGNDWVLCARGCRLHPAKQLDGVACDRPVANESLHATRSKMGTLYTREEATPHH